MNSHTSTRKSVSNACSRLASRTPDFASSRESSTPAYLSHTSPTSAARSSMRIQRLTFFLALPSVCRPTTRLTTLVRPLFPAPPCPSRHSSPAPAQTQMTRLPFCWRLTCSRGQHSLQLLPLPRSDYTLRTPNSRTSSCTWSRGL